MEECEDEVKRIELHHVTMHKQVIEFWKFECLNNCNWKREEILVWNSWKTIHPSTLVGMNEFDLFAFELVIALCFDVYMECC